MTKFKARRAHGEVTKLTKEALKHRQEDAVRLHELNLLVGPFRERADAGILIISNAPVKIAGDRKVR